MRIPASFSTLIAAAPVLIGCTEKDFAYRITAFGNDAAACNTSLLVSKSAYVDGDYAETMSARNSQRIGCNISRYEIPRAKACRDMANGKRINADEADEYTLSFVEMPEKTSGLLKPQQLSDLLATFERNRKAGKQNIVMTYIHSWRHDAALGNGNVIRFRTILGYTRSALNARYIETGEYCDASLTGVYLSWCGRSFNEPVSVNAAGPWLTGGLWTNWARKAQSETLTTPTIERNTEEAKCRPPKHGARENSSIVGGTLRAIARNHGGNMLAHYLRPKALDQIECHAIGDEMKPLLDDLVVLLNPASEAAKWTALQYKMREHAGIPDDVYNVSSNAGLSPQEAHALSRWKGMFPPRQRPFYISLTAAGDWGSVEDGQQNPDNATRLIFPVSKFLLGQTQREQRTAIGHLLPKYATPSGSGKMRPAGAPVGTTHEFIVNRGLKVETSYINSGTPAYSSCGSHSGWLYRAQQRDKEGWDTGWLDQHAPYKFKNVGLDTKGEKAEVQIRQYLQPNKKNYGHSVAQSTSPF